MKLIICGNGFDLHHGFKTDYQSYRKFLLENYPYSLRDFENFQYVSLTNSDRWSDLEESLSLNYEDCVSDSLSIFYPKVKNESDSRWYGFQIDLEQQIKFVYDFTGHFLFEWLDNVDYSLASKKLDLNHQDLYLTFNYTSTLEIVYEIPNENIFHIHGSIESVEKHHNRQHIQFGSIYNDSQLIKEHSEAKYGDDEFYSVSIEPGIANLIGFCNAASKDLKKNYRALKNYITQKEFNQVIIMGHSIMGVDKAYYNDIIVPILRDCFWTFYYYDDENFSDAKQFVEQFSIEKYEYIKW